jgi:hypothetical protein
VGLYTLYTYLNKQDADWRDGFHPIGECNLPELGSWEGKADGWNPYWRILLDW